MHSLTMTAWRIQGIIIKKYVYVNRQMCIVICLVNCTTYDYLNTRPPGGYTCREPAETQIALRREGLPFGAA